MKLMIKMVTKTDIEQFLFEEWEKMLIKSYTCKCENHTGFAINLKHIHVFGRRFKDILKKKLSEIKGE